jgi:hypothetical protein
MLQHPTPEVRHSELAQLAWDLIACSLLVKIGEQRARELAVAEAAYAAPSAQVSR